jgi:glycosyltransferase involved in cell wall biosynthesis
MEEILKRDFEIWSLDDQSEQFFRVSSQNLTQSMPLLNSYIFYCVKKFQALSICFFSHSPGIGGSEKMMFDLVGSLVQDYGVVCTAVLPRPGSQSEALREIGVATIFAFSSFPFYGWWCDDAGTDRPKKDQQLQIINASKAIEMNVLPCLHKVDPDVIWTQSMVIPWGAKVSQILNKPHIWYVTEFGRLDFGFQFFNSFVDVLDEIQATSNHVYTCSQVLKDTLFPMAEKEKVSTLYCRIPPPVIEMTRNSEQYFLKKDSVKIGMFSQIRPTKGQEDAVLAVAECIRNGLNMELLIVGDAADQTYQNYLMYLAEDLGVKDNIIFTGYATKPFDLMALCDVVVMSSRLEAFGRVGVEAMLLNKPVVFANTGGISEYQLNGQTGLSYTPGDSHALAMQLRILVSDPALRKKMGIAAKEHALNLFSKENFSDRVYFEAKKIATQGRGDCNNPKIIDKLIQGASESPGIEKNIQKFIGRNEVCPCNSGKKYKHCCGIIG